MFDTVKGGLRGRAWPRTRGKPKTAAEKERQEAFRWAQFASKYVAPEMMANIQNMVKGSPLLPRDITTMMFYGRLFKLITETGKVWWPMAARQDVSEALDAITQDVGFGLMRGNDGWQGQPFSTGSGMQLLGTTQLLAANPVIEVTGLPTTSSHIVLIAQLRSDAGGSAANANLRLNGDAGGNYGYERWNKFGVARNLATNQIDLASAATNGGSPNSLSPIFAVIPFYSATGLARSVLGFSGQRLGSDAVLNFSWGEWRNSANPITAVRLTASAGNWIIGSRLQAWGI